MEQEIREDIKEKEDLQVEQLQDDLMKVESAGGDREEKPKRKFNIGKMCMKYIKKCFTVDWKWKKESKQALQCL